jgi:glycosyltransferase involved in cell wall biosynthesis
VPLPAATAPLVSVCIPAWQGAHVLPQTVASVLAQSLKDFELLVVDDASSDGTAACLAAFGDPRIRVVAESQNLGAEGNWNRCLALARGRYLKLLPQDDPLHPECLKEQVAVLEADAAHHIALVFCARQVIGPQGQVMMARRGVPGALGRREGPVPAHELLAACIHHGTNVIGEPGAVMFRRSLAQQIGPFSARYPYVVDLDYWVRLLQHGAAWQQSAVRASFRVWAGSWSVALLRQHRQDFECFVAAMQVRGLMPRPAGLWPRLRARTMPAINQMLRWAFYRVVLR